jgi:cytosine/adenosine deaminase-related metal-dependent hydrolase
VSSSLIRGKYVILKVTGKFSADVISDGCIYQENGLIQEIGPYQDLHQRYPSVEVIGGNKFLIFPGLVNDHDHIGMSSIQLGIAHTNLELTGLQRIGSRTLDPYLEHLHGAVQMIESGTTTVQIMYTPGRGLAPIDDESTDKVIRAYQDVGVRLCYAPILQDQNSMVGGPRGGETQFAQSLPGNLGQRFSNFMGNGYWPVDELIDASEDVIKKYNGTNRGRVTVNTAPTNVQRCSDRLLSGLKDLSMKYETTTHIHLLETIYQKLFGLRLYGKSAVQHLDDIGFLGNRVVCGHSIWLTEEDVDILQKTGTNVCHNASSNLRLLSGIAPIPYLLQKGIKVSLGIDDMGMNDDKDMLQEMRLVLKLHRIPGVEFEPITPFQVFEMATTNGAVGTGLGTDIGSLEVGKKADMVLLDLKRLETPYLAPESSILEILIQRGKEIDVDTVIVDGEVVMKDKNITKIDKEKLYGEIKDALDRPLTKDEEEAKALALEVYPYLKRFYHGSIGRLNKPFSQYNAK